MMEVENILKQYTEIEDRIFPIKEFLLNNQNNSKYNKLFKGIITLQSPLIYNPEILFIGINPGDGAYKELNNKENNSEIIIPLRMLGENEQDFRELNWFQTGNARGEHIHGSKSWIGYKWFQRDKKVNNSFPANLIDLLYHIGNEKYSKSSETRHFDNNSIPFWFNDLGQKIMYTNLYPISTENLNDLNKMLNSLGKEKDLSPLWKKHLGNSKRINNWTVRKFFIRNAEDLVRITKPKIIVCMGLSAFNDFSYSHQKNKKIVYAEKRLDDDVFPVIGFNRKGSWKHIVNEVALKIKERMD
jgi:hypothetical protein